MAAFVGTRTAPFRGDARVHGPCRRLLAEVCCFSSHETAGPSRLDQSMCTSKSLPDMTEAPPAFAGALRALMSFAEEPKGRHQRPRASVRSPTAPARCKVKVRPQRGSRTCRPLSHDDVRHAVAGGWCVVAHDANRSAPFPTPRRIVAQEGNANVEHLRSQTSSTVGRPFAGRCLSLGDRLRARHSIRQYVCVCVKLKQTCLLAGLVFEPMLRVTIAFDAHARVA